MQWFNSSALPLLLGPLQHDFEVINNIGTSKNKYTIAQYTVTQGHGP